ncbi:MAG: hypothetical protein JST43_08585 [Bacteroidetes bacterium]|nr:hypothetical protein [Bacteroidota bacterium]MBS1541429.1 hypothetical protein [Bacteroidota bacterium]
MKITYVFAIAFIVLSACGKSANHEEYTKTEAENPNEALYEQVMDVHDEVMPKSDQLYSLKKELLEKLKNKDLPNEAKKHIDTIIQELDSADHAMMDWMHRFRPLPDSANREAAREYLEDEMLKIKKVRELTFNSLQKAKDELGKK